MDKSYKFTEEDIVRVRLMDVEVQFWLPDENDHIQSIIRNTESFYELELLLHSMTTLSRGDLVVDIGANIGNHAVFWAAICGCEVLAVEPNPEALEILRKNIELNGVESLVSVSGVAAGSSDSKGRLIQGEPRNIGQARVLLESDGSVDVKTTDNLIRTTGSPVALIKVDVEGSELDVLSGAIETLRDDRPKIYCEAATAEQHALLDRFFKSINYICLRRFNFTPTYYFVDAHSVELLDAVLQSSQGMLEGSERKIEESFRRVYRELSKSNADIGTRLTGISDQLSRAGQSDVSIHRSLKRLESLGEENRKSLNAALDALPEMRGELIEQLESYQAKQRKELRGSFDERQRQTQQTIEESVHGFASKIEGLSQSNQSHINRLNAKIDGFDEKLGQLVESFDHVRKENDGLNARLKRLQAQRDQYSEKVVAVRRSASFQIGNALVEFVRHPIRGVIELPRRLLKLCLGRRTRAASTARSRHAKQGSFGDGTAGPGPSQNKSVVGASCDQVIEPGRFRTRESLLEDQFTNGFGAWKANQSVKLGQGGRITILQDSSTPGIKRLVGVRHNSCFKLTVEASWNLRHGDPLISIVDAHREMHLCPQYKLTTPGSSAIYFQTLSTTQEIVINILVRNPSKSDELNINSVSLVEVEDSGLSGKDAGRADPEIPIVASLASIPSREAQLRDCVNSLLCQVDELRVYLNGYVSVPEYLLKEPKIRVIRSQDYGDQGDAGKFFDACDLKPEYLLTCDDDIVYPLDYVSRMIRALECSPRGAVVGVHGVVLKQPFQAYYDDSTRVVFRHVNALERRTCVHVLGTGTTAMRTDRSGVSSELFQYPNMADVWLARHAQESAIPLVAIDRERFWLRQNEGHAIQGDSKGEPSNIFDASTSGSDTSLNTGLMQTKVLQQVTPLTVPVRYERDGIVKAVMSVTTFNRVDYLREFIDSFWKTCDKSFQWVLIVADDGSTDGTLDYLDSLRLPLEVHIIKNQRRYAVGQTNTIFSLAKQLGFDIGFEADDDVVFMKPGWDRKYFDAIKETGFDHLCYLNLEHFAELRQKHNPDFVLERELDATGRLEAHCSVEFCMGAFFTFTEKMLDLVGGADEKNFPIRGQWHIDLSARACRAGLNSSQKFYDVVGSNELIALQNNLRSDYRCSISWDEDYKKTKDPEEMKRRTEVINDSSRVKVKAPSCKTAAFNHSNGKSLNDVIDKAFVLNLERREDRLETFLARAGKADVRVERFDAIDGTKEPYKSQWERYFAQPTAKCPQDASPVMGSKDYYLGRHCERARLAFLESKLGRKAIQSPGAWGYLLTLKDLLEKAIREGYRSIAVFDDDAVFHADFPSEFNRIYRSVPRDWTLLQLGTLQYHWGDEWIEWVNDSLYLGFGTGLASHALVIHSRLFPLLLWHCQKMELPFDEGALHYAHQAYPRSCYTFYPNLVIQDVSESDINSSDVQELEGSKEVNVYRWQLDRYNF